jgi:hypothetical protein
MTNLNNLPISKFLNKSNTLAKGLIGSWLLNERGGKVAIESIRSKNGTVSSGANFSIFRDNCIYTAGSNTSFLNLGNGANVISTQEMSISIWVNPITLAGPATSGADLLRRENSYEIEFLNGGVNSDFGFKTSGGGNPMVNVPQSLIPLGVWTHLVMTASSTDRLVRVYINGRYYGSSFTGLWPVGQTINNTTANNTYVGVYGTTAPSSNRGFNGYTKNIQFWNRKLIDQEVSSLYLSPYQMYEFRNPITRYQEIIPPRGGSWLFFD